LLYASWTGSTWNIETVDITGPGVRMGFSVSLFLDSTDKPHISYHYMDGHLKYASWTGDTWNIETVSYMPLTEKCVCSLFLDSTDKPHISYRFDASRLYYASRTGDTWNIETVDWFDDHPGDSISLFLDSTDKPHISYYRASYDKLKYASWTGDTWNIEDVTPASGGGACSSIFLDSTDKPHISYWDNQNGCLKYASRTGDTWNIETVDTSSENVGASCSLFLDSSDRPHISYIDSYNASLKYASWTGDAWSIETVDSPGIDGISTSLFLDSNNNPHISYYDYQNGNLKYASIGLPTHDGAVTNIKTCKTIVGQGLKMRLNVTIENQGSSTEAFDVAVFANCESITDGLTAYWDFDEGSGTMAEDDSGNGYDGTIYGSSWVEGKFGNALSFDGVDDFVSAPFVPLNDRSFTVVMWVRAAELPDFPEDASLLSQFDEASTGKYLHILVRNSLPFFGFYGDDLWGNTHLNRSAWYHLAFVYNYTSNTKAIYVNGVLDASAPSIGPYKGVSGNTTIGKYLDSSFNGTIDEVRIYSRALTAQELKAIAGSGAIHTQTITLESGATTEISFIWNTLAFTKGNYTITATVSPLPSETDLADNTFTDGWIIIAMVADVTGPDGWPDGKVNMRDIGAISRLFGTQEGDPDYNANYDITGPTEGLADGKINMRDIGLAARHFGEIDP